MNEAIGLLTDLVGAIATTTFQVLMDGNMPDFDGHSDEWVQQAELVDEEYTKEQLEHHALVVTTVREVSEGLLSGYIKSLIEVGLVEAPLPSPDDITVPDSVEEIDW
jgi:hypothetical protein